MGQQSMTRHNTLKTPPFFWDGNDSCTVPPPSGLRCASALPWPARPARTHWRPRQPPPPCRSGHRRCPERAWRTRLPAPLTSDQYVLRPSSPVWCATGVWWAAMKKSAGSHLPPFISISVPCGRAGFLCGGRPRDPETRRDQGLV
jgi:hypothetical protein